MLTRSEKQQEIAEGTKAISGSKNLVFADFTGVPTAEIRKLKIELRKIGAAYRVMKKRLLNLALKRSNVPVDATTFSGQVATVFIPGELTEAAAPLYKFQRDMVKAKKNFAVLGAYDLGMKQAITVEQFTAIAKLPSREVLLAQVLGGMTGTLRKFMYTLGEIAKAKQVASS